MESILCPHREQKEVLPQFTGILLGVGTKYSNLIYLSLTEIDSLLKPQFPAIRLQMRG